MLKLSNNTEQSDDYKQFMKMLHDGKHLNTDIIPISYTSELTPVNEMGIEVQRYMRITHDGTYCVVTPEECAQIILGNDEYKIEAIWMTQEEYNNLPEFEGF